MRTCIDISENVHLVIIEVCMRSYSINCELCHSTSPFNSSLSLLTLASLCCDSRFYKKNIKIAIVTIINNHSNTIFHAFKVLFYFKIGSTNLLLVLVFLVHHTCYSFIYSHFVKNNILIKQ